MILCSSEHSEDFLALYFPEVIIFLIVLKYLLAGNCMALLLTRGENGDSCYGGSFLALTSEGPLGGALWESHSSDTVLWEVAWGLPGFTMLLPPHLLFGTVVLQDQSLEFRLQMFDTLNVCL